MATTDAWDQVCNGMVANMAVIQLNLDNDQMFDRAMRQYLPHHRTASRFTILPVPAPQCMPRRSTLTRRRRPAGHFSTTTPFHRVVCRPPPPADSTLPPHNRIQDTICRGVEEASASEGKHQRYILRGGCSD